MEGTKLKEKFVGDVGGWGVGGDGRPFFSFGVHRDVSGGFCGKNEPRTQVGVILVENSERFGVHLSKGPPTILERAPPPFVGVQQGVCG